MARKGKDPKPYTLKTQRGERPYSYSEQHGAWRNAVMNPRADQGAVREAAYAWSRRFNMFAEPKARAA